MLFSLFLLAMVSLPKPVIAGVNRQEWSTPTVISTNAQASDPYMALDSYGVLHAVWGGVSNPGPRSYTDMIYYARWSDTGWSDPVDIFFSYRDEDTRYPVIAAANDTLHIVWAGDMGNLYYSNAPLCAPEDVRSWDQPRLLVDDNLGVSRPHLRSAQDGSLHLVYARSVDNASVIVYLRSNDNGRTWSQPIAVSEYNRDVLVWLPIIEIDANNVLHVTWSKTMATENYGPLGVAYARSLDGGQSWSPAFEMAGAGYGRSNLLAINADEIHIVWSGTVGTAGRYHRWSSDGGQTWTNVDRLPAVEQAFGGGFNGMVADRIGRVHVITGVEYMTYLMWQQGQWVSAQRIWDVDYSYGDPVIEGGASKIALFGGNRLISLWHDNWRIFFATKLLDLEPTTSSGPVLCSTPIAIQPVVPEVIAVPPTSSPVVSNPIIPTRAAPTETREAIHPVIIGAAPALALVALVAIWQTTRSRRP